MKRFTFLAVPLLLTGLAVSALGDSTEEFVSPEDLTTGQKGYGLTVFQGDQPERFEVEFVATTPHPAYLKEKAILVRLKEPLTNLNVIEGMSGSPVYFKHEGKWKLAGALAFSHFVPAGKEYLAGVTPIHLMINQQEVLGLRKAPILEPKSLSEAGYSPEEETADTAKVLKPGDTIIVMFADGDYQEGFLGTVTYVKGNRFWALGHGATGDGAVLFPANQASIAVSLKGSNVGMKLLKEIKGSVGIITYDNVFGIEGVIQEVPANLMLPVNLQLTAPTGEKAQFSFRTVKNKLYTADLISGGVRALLKRLWNNGDRAAATANSVISFEDRPPVFLSETAIVGKIIHFGPFTFSNGPWSIADKTVQAINELLDNDFGFRLSKVSIKFALEPVQKSLYLYFQRAVNAKGEVLEKVKPGEEFYLLLGLRSYDGSKQFLARLPFRIPEKLDFKEEDEEQTIAIRIESGNNFEEQDKSKIPDRNPENQEEFLRALLLNERLPYKIYIQLVLPPIREKSSPLPLPALTSGQWQSLNNLDELKKREATKEIVLSQELLSPLPNYVLGIEQTLNLKLVVKKEEKSKQKKVLKKKK